MSSYRYSPVYRLRLVLLIVVVAMVAGTLIVSGARAAEYTREFTFDSRELTVHNMVGQVRVEQGAGDQFQVEVTIAGDDAEEGLIDFAVQHESHGQLVVQFPLDEHDRYVYPRMGRNSNSTITYRDERDDSSWIKKVFRDMTGRRVKVSGNGRGLEVWADVVIKVPAGQALNVKLGVGDIAAEDMTAYLDLDTSSGPIEAHRIEGDLVADTGSGMVVVSAVTGDVNIDTGSGRVEAADCTCDLFSVDTGSGRVEVQEIACRRLNIDTGSGRVTAHNVAADRAKIDTGSGSVELELDRMGEGRFIIDTGSGGIDLVLPENASAQIEADTGSGRVKYRGQDARIEHKERDELRMTIGDGDARVTLDAGSGSITISQR